ncbi:hypothetical protein PTTG_29429 [Puccinia triticina 1-1 BBBD Race 1]|uniref:Uncharacterized protein n=1 Tax=Puccinia triticina (isolate 1-1 / race 1 (BBBD)) TaxID=630390 RepID=A0A180G4T2_PUCT1|nr:hypothetical protein PTTG_29429 [Puccinia triticina 1-1 BBBD Race 1]
MSAKQFITGPSGLAHHHRPPAGSASKHPSPLAPIVQINNPSSIGHTHPNFFHAPPD